MAGCVGYKKDNIEIKITEDGKEIWVSGHMQVQEMTIIPLKKEEEKVKGFIKKFKIPKGVVLDGIKASYEEEEWKLTIVMPKIVKGISGVGIEEVKDEIEEEKKEEDQNDNNSGISKVEGELQSVEEEMKKEEEEEEKPSDEEMKKTRPRKPWKPCPPLLLGGPAFLVTLLFLVIHFIKLKHNK